jgi:energy-coupling factor transport system ATP-binding protein
MIEISSVTYTYPNASYPALRDVSLRIEEGEFLLVCGPSGAGKSSFLRLLNGLIPHFYGGSFAGTVRVWGKDTLAHQPRDLSDLVGFVFQDPEAQFVVDLVEDEIVFGMENLNLPLPIMRRRVEEVLDQLGIAHLRRRRISSLSGGERQRVAIAAVMAAQPRVLVLDEPTSQLDPHGAEEVLTALQKLNADLGLTIVLCEHRLERVVQYADRILYLEAGGREQEAGLLPPAACLLLSARDALASIPLVPPLQALGRALHWQPLPLTIKEGRRFAAQAHISANRSSQGAGTTASSTIALRVTNLTLRYDDHEALYKCSLTARSGELLALMGRNGSGKSSLLRAIMGLAQPQEGRIELAGKDITRLKAEERAGQIGYTPQDPRSILFHDTLWEELAFSIQNSKPKPQTSNLKTQIETTLAALNLSHHAQSYPRALSGGEAQRAALAAILVNDPQLLLLDEPTRGLDYEAKAELGRLLRARCAAGSTVIMATHDVELVAAIADRVALLGDGELIVEGPTAEVLGESLLFSSQIAKLFPGRGWLTVEDVLKAGGRRQEAGST